MLVFFVNHVWYFVKRHCCQDFHELRQDFHELRLKM